MPKHITSKIYPILISIVGLCWSGILYYLNSEVTKLYYDSNTPVNQGFVIMVGALLITLPFICLANLLILLFENNERTDFRWMHVANFILGIIILVLPPILFFAILVSAYPMRRL